MNSDAIEHMIQAVGPLWLVAVAGLFLSAVCESARPKPVEGEEKSGGIALFIAGIASLITPLLLFIGGFWSIAGFENAAVTPDMVFDVVQARRVVVFGLFGALAGVVIAGSVIGWIVRAAAPSLGKTLNLAAVPLAIATLALAAFVTHEDVATVLALVGAR